VNVPVPGALKETATDATLCNDLSRSMIRLWKACADDCNIYVRSRRAGQRLMGGLTRLLEGKLKLKVNRERVL
jgi:retron-type reverse transcriptase